LRAEVVFAVRHEMAASIEDVLARRTGLQLYSWRDAMKAAPVVAQLLGQEFGWSEVATRDAAAQYIAKTRDLMIKAGLPAGGSVSSKGA
jgi:glycerol-3-phosphate dehydrogenase